MPKPNSYAEVVRQIQEIHDRGKGLTAWEQLFIQDCLDKLDLWMGHRFSARQREHIQRIHKERV